MQTTVIAGVDSVVGANLLAELRSHASVAGIVTSGPAITLPGCSVEVCSDQSTEAVRRLLQRWKPSRLVVCGPGAASCWDESLRPTAAGAQQTRNWIEAAAVENLPLTLISSDAVFTGPWMFHPETSQSWCPSPEAVVLRQLEDYALEQSPQTLILRTHAFGWTPGDRGGWLERMVDRLTTGHPLPVDCFRHASPILASDIPELLIRIWAEGLAGVYHLAGAERINPVTFLRKLAVQFGLPQPQFVTTESPASRVQGFGGGETSLQTRKLRRALGAGLPLLTEGLRRLYQQQESGYRALLQNAAGRPSRVA